jgi:hypothetical protein
MIAKGVREKHDMFVDVQIWAATPSLLLKRF